MLNEYCRKKLYIIHYYKLNWSKKMSPYRRVGKTVYKKEGGHLISKGTSATIEKAKAHMKALYAHSSDTKSKRKK